MASCGNRGAAGRKNLRVLLPFTRDSLRIPDELAGEVAADEAFVVAPFGKGRVRPVGVGQDRDGAFLGRGWPEFAGACGVRAGWSLVLRHHGGGLLTVKVFDASCCLRELATRSAAVEEPISSTDSSRRPQFISVLAKDSMEKLSIPARFVQNYIPKGHMNNRTAVLFGPIGKICQVELKMNGPDTFFSGAWQQFVALHGITKANCLVLRYEGNMTFTVKVFGPNGCHIDSKQNGSRMQQISTLFDVEKKQELPSASIQKCKSKIGRLCSEEQKKPKPSTASLNKAPHQKRSFYEIGPPSWIKKVINSSTLKSHLSLAKDFCNVIGLQEPCTITLKISMDSTEAWQVHGRTSENSSYIISHGWKRFCEENGLKEGDMCTFQVVETTLWHVIITRCEEKETPSASSSKRKSDIDMSSGREQKGPNAPMTSLNRICAFEIGPPAWMRKEINASTTTRVFSLPLTFCEAIGLREPCTVTLKTSLSSTTSWQARVVPYKYCNHMLGPGWKSFCQENRIKEGDVCTFNVVDKKLWHVVIAHK